MQKYKQHRLKLSQVAAAARAGLSERSARRIEQSEALPSQRESRAWRTRADPLAAVWDNEVVPLLETDGALTVSACRTQAWLFRPPSRTASASMGWP